MPELQWVSPHHPQLDDDMASRGWRRVRLLHQMRRPLPLEPEVVAGTRPAEVRPIRIEDPEDRAGFLRVNNRAFDWHPEQGGWDEDRLRARTTEPWFDPEGFLVHEGADGSIDGFCWTKEHPAGHSAPEDPPLGEIYVIAADPDTHGTGLGRALTVAGLEHLSRRGLRTAMLYVEADNVAAVGLYERLGFTVHHSDAAYAPAS